VKEEILFLKHLKSIDMVIPVLSILRGMKDNSDAYGIHRCSTNALARYATLLLYSIISHRPFYVKPVAQSQQYKPMLLDPKETNRSPREGKRSLDEQLNEKKQKCPNLNQRLKK